MIKVTIGQIVNVMPILRRLVKEEFQGRNAFVAARLIREITKENDTFEIARLELIKKYCDKDENGEMIVSEEGNVHIPMDAMKACTEELLKMQEVPAEINAEKMPIDWLEKVNITPAEAEALEPFVEF